jgi:hypothetical protein
MMMKVDEFLSMYGDIIFDQHKPEFLRFQRMKRSRNGFHYRSCPWFSDDAIDGPDTCQCVYEVVAEERIKRLIHLYLRMFNNKKC